MKGRAMTRGTPWKQMVNFAFPILAGALLQQLYNTADTIIVGNFSGEAALAAVGTTGTFVFLSLAAAIGFSAGNGVLVSQFFGAGNEAQVRKNASTGILLLLGAGLMLTAAGIGLAHPACKYLIAVPEKILDLSVLYFRIYALGLVFQFGYNILASILRSIGDSAATLYFLLIASLLNIALDLVLVAGFRQGVAGAAAATVISQAASMAAAWYYMDRKYPFLRFRLRNFTWDTRIARETLRVGFPITVQMVVVSLGLTLIMRAVNSFGEVMTASFTVGQRIEMYLRLPCNALQATLATYTGQNIGAGKMRRVRLGVRQGELISIGLTLFISLCVWVFSGPIVRMFALSSQAAVYCNAHLRAVALTNILLASYIPLFGVFQGARHCSMPTIVAFAALTTRVAVTYLLKDSPFFGYRIIWWNSLFGYCLGGTIAWCYYFSGRWQKDASVTGRPLDRSA
ncbi:MAG: MATE family efflux transporter [Lentisphaeria bacterium]|nr:MATE family efflux transporter [Lentisphaeria bacterium]